MHAQAFETIFFRGVPGSQIPNAMLGTDETLIKSKHKAYFDEFYGKNRFRTFIISSSTISNGKEKGISNSTVEVTINYSALRKDLESKGLKRGFGL